MKNQGLQKNPPPVLEMGFMFLKKYNYSLSKYLLFNLSFSSPSISNRTVVVLKIFEPL